MMCNCENPEVAYNEKYDATCCLKCRKWISPVCNNPDCHWCKNRSAMCLNEPEKRDDRPGSSS
jgi:hypothetical protein